MDWTRGDGLGRDGVAPRRTELVSEMFCASEEWELSWRRKGRSWRLC